MMDNHHLRGIILKLENRLSDNDRKRLHFFIGNDVPRRIRDDSSLSGTLSLMESLFDQDKINEKDFTFLINAFHEIQCIDAAELLREHMKRMQSSTIHELTQSLASVMPCNIDKPGESQDEDKYAIKTILINQQNNYENSIEMIGVNNIDVNPVIDIVENHTSRSNRKKIFNASSMIKTCLLIFVPLSIIGLGVLTSVIIVGYYQYTKYLKIKDENILKERAKNNQIIQRLNNLRLEDTQNIEYLTNLLRQRCTESTSTINGPVATTEEWAFSCGCPSISTCLNNCMSKFGGISGRCSGIRDLTCECLIGDVWQSKARQC